MDLVDNQKKAELTQAPRGSRSAEIQSKDVASDLQDNSLTQALRGSRSAEMQSNAVATKAGKVGFNIPVGEEKQLPLYQHQPLTVQAEVHQENLRSTRNNENYRGNSVLDQAHTTQRSRDRIGSYHSENVAETRTTGIQNKGGVSSPTGLDRPEASQLSREHPLATFEPISGNRYSHLLDSPLNQHASPQQGQSSTRVLTPERSISQEGQLNYSVNRQLALSSLKSNTRTNKFDGKDKASYCPWKVAIELETEGPFLSDAEWLEILQLRTAGIALELVKEGRKLALINPSKAVQFIWDKFNKRYGKKCQ